MCVVVVGGEEVFQRGQEVELLQKEEVFFCWRDRNRTQELGVIEWRECNGAEGGFVDAFPRAKMMKEMGYRLLVLRLNGCSDCSTYTHALVE